MKQQIRLLVLSFIFTTCLLFSQPGKAYAQNSSWEVDSIDNLGVGSLAGQNNWVGSPDIRVINNPLFPNFGKVVHIAPLGRGNIALGKAVSVPAGLRTFQFRVNVPQPGTTSDAKLEVQTNFTAYGKKYQVFVGQEIRINVSPTVSYLILSNRSFIPGKWYEIRCEMNLFNDRLNVYLDGNPVLQNILMSPGPITNLGVTGFDRGVPVTVYLDNLLGF